MRIFAQIKNSIVVNTIVLDSLQNEALFLEGFNFLIEITTTDPQPGIGWGYDGASFLAPGQD